MKNDNKDFPLQIRFTQIEKTILINEASKKGITIADMMRGLLNKEFGQRIFKKVS